MKRTRKAIVLVNDFHGTRTTVRVLVDRSLNGQYLIQPHQAYRALRMLCGITGCTCGGVRGGEWHMIEDLLNGEKIHYVERRDGGWE